MSHAPPPQQQGFAPAVANLFSAHAQQQQQQQQAAAPPLPPPHYHQQPPYQPHPHHQHLQQQMHAQQPHASYPPQGHAPPPPFPGPFPFAPQNNGGPPPPPPHQFAPHHQHPQHAPPQHMYHHQQHHPHMHMQQHPPPQMSPPSYPYPSPTHSPEPASDLGVGALLSANDASAESDTPAAAPGLVLPSPHHTLSVSPVHKSLGGEEHANTPCTEYSSIAREAALLQSAVAGKNGRLIAHQQGITLFALKGGLVRLVYEPPSAEGSEESSERQLEVLKGGHSSAVIDISFLASSQSEGEVLVATLSEKEVVVWQITLPKGKDGKVAFKVVAKIASTSLYRLRVQPTRSTHIALLHSTGRVSLLPVEELPAQAGAIEQLSPAEGAEQLQNSSVTDLAWTASGEALYLSTREGALLQYVLASKALRVVRAPAEENAAAIERVIPLADDLLLLVSRDHTLLQLYSPSLSQVTSSLRMSDGQEEELIFSSVEAESTGQLVFLSYRRASPTGEESDTGFFVLHVRRVEGVALFDFVTVFFQPAALLSFGVTVHQSAAAGSLPDVDLVAVEMKPVVKLLLKASALYRELTAEEKNRLIQAVAEEKRKNEAEKKEVVQASAPTKEPAPLELKVEEATEEEEAHDAGRHGMRLLFSSSSLRSSLPKLPPVEEAPATTHVVAEEADAATAAALPLSPRASTSPPASSPIVTVTSPTFSARQQQQQSPGLTRRTTPERTSSNEFPPIDEDGSELVGIGFASLSSGRTSPALISSSTSPAKQPVLRPRGNSVESRNVQFAAQPAAAAAAAASTGPPTSTPTPASTPIPGTPSLSRLNSLNHLPSTDPSPLPSPRRRATSMSGSPPSPFQHMSVATTSEASREASAAGSPLNTSPSSPLVSPSPSSSPTPTPGSSSSAAHMDESGMSTMPSTPHAGATSGTTASSTVTPAPTPLALSAPGVSLSQMSTADVSLHFLSARLGTGSEREKERGTAEAPSRGTTTPMNTPASSVPSTPRLSGVPGSLTGLPLPTPTGVSRRSSGGLPSSSGNASLRVRTPSHSGSTSPSPISSPRITSSLSAYHRARTASMDESRWGGIGAGSLLAESVLEEPSEDARKRYAAAVAAHTGASASGPASRSATPNDAAALPSPAPAASSSSSLPTPPSDRPSGKEKQEATLLHRLDQLFARHLSRLSNSLNTTDAQRMESMMAKVSSSVAEELDRQIRDNVLPGMEQAVAEALEKAGGQASSSSSSISTSELSASLTAGLRTTLVEGLRSTFASTLLPSFETSIQAMLGQIQKSVSSVVQGSAQAEKNKAKQAQVALEKQMADEAAALAKERESLLSLRRSLEADLEKRRAEEAARAQESADREKAMLQMVSMMAALTKEVKELKQAQTQATQAVSRLTPTSPHTASAASAAPMYATPPTPSSPSSAASATTPDPSLMSAILSLVAQEQFEAAFTRALSAGSLPVVLTLCRQFDPRRLLTTNVAGHKLSAPVLLSLLQQLACSIELSHVGVSASASVSSDLKLKLSWLKELLMVLPTADSLIRAHVPAVLREVLVRVEALQIGYTHDLFDEQRMVGQLAQAKLAAMQTHA